MLFSHIAEQMFGCKAEEALGRPLAGFIEGAFVTRIAAHHAIRQIQRDLSQDGTVGYNYWLRVSLQEFRITAGISQVTVEGPDYFTVILRDITERQQAQVVLNEAQEHHEDIF